MKPVDLAALVPQMLEFNQLLMPLMLTPWSEKLTTIEEKADLILNQSVYKLSFLYFAEILSKEANNGWWLRLAQFHYHLIERCRVNGISSTREDATLKSTFESVLATRS